MKRFENLLKIKHFAGVSLKERLQCIGYLTFRIAFSTFFLTHSQKIIVCFGAKIGKILEL